MKKPFLLFTALMLWMPCLAHAASLSAGFTYQGRLTDHRSPANGAYDMRFTLHSASSGSEDDRHIATVDEAGVALAAIQGSTKS